MQRVPRDVSIHLWRAASDGPRFLMLRRTHERGGFWQGVTGAPLPGETDLDAAVREVGEETGYDVRDALRPLGITYSYRLRPELADRWMEIYGSGVSAVTVVCFGAEVATGLDACIDRREHDASQWWCRYDTALAMLDWPVESDALVARRAALQAVAHRFATAEALMRPPDVTNPLQAGS